MKKIVFKNAFLLLLPFGFQALAGVLNYVFNIVVLKRLNSMEFVQYNKLVGIVYLLQVIAVSIQNSVNKYTVVASNLKKDVVYLYKKSFIYSLIISLFVWGGSLFILKDLSFATITTMVFYLFVVLFAFVPKGVLLGLGRITLTNFIILLEAIAKLTAGFFVTTSYQAILSFCAPMLISALFIIWYIGYILKSNGSKPTLQKNLKLESELKKKNIKGSNNLIKDYVITGITLLLVTWLFSMDINLIPRSLSTDYSVLILYGKLIFFATNIVPMVLFAKWVACKDFKSLQRLVFIGIFIQFVIAVPFIILSFIAPDLLSKFLFNGTYFPTNILALYSIGVFLYSFSVYFIYLILTTHSKSQIYWLLGLILLQFILFRINNRFLISIILNQLIVYTLSLGLSIVNLLLVFFYRQNKKL